MISIPDINIDLVRSLPRVEYRDTYNLPEGKGIYCVCVDYPDFQVLYVGQSSNIRSRFSGHSRKDEFDAILLTQPVWVQYLSLDWDQSDIEILEYVFIRKIAPMFNTANALDGLIVIPEIPKEKRMAIASSISKPLGEYNSQELADILDIIGIPLGSFKKSKSWMISTIRRCLGDQAKQVRVHDLDRYRKNKLQESIVVSEEDIKNNLSSSSDIKLGDVYQMRTTS